VYYYKEQPGREAKLVPTAADCDGGQTERTGDNSADTAAVVNGELKFLSQNSEECRQDGRRTGAVLIVCELDVLSEW